MKDIRTAHRAPRTAHRAPFTQSTLLSRSRFVIAYDLILHATRLGCAIMSFIALRASRLAGCVAPFPTFACARDSRVQFHSNEHKRLVETVHR
jgi:hypothetical protein